MPTMPRPTETPPHDAVTQDASSGGRLGMRSLGLIVVAAVAALTAIFVLRPGVDPVREAGPIAAATVIRGPASTADLHAAHQPAPAVVILAQDVFPTADALRYAGREARLDGMIVTETVGDRFVYLRPAALPNERPLLVDVADARDLELAPSQLVTVHGIVRLADEAIETVLTDRQRERLDAARIYLDAQTIVAPPET